jgi:hypothetical protein
MSRFLLTERNTSYADAHHSAYWRRDGSGQRRPGGPMCPAGAAAPARPASSQRQPPPALALTRPYCLHHSSRRRETPGPQAGGQQEATQKYFEGASHFAPLQGSIEVQLSTASAQRKGIHMLRLQPHVDNLTCT